MREISLNHKEFAELSADVLAQQGSLYIRAHGFSMYPFIRNGDIISVQPSNINAFRIGDVVLYRSGEKKLVAHRVIGRRLKNGQMLLRMCGDTAPEHNEWVPAAHALGRVDTILRGNKIIHLDKGLLRVLSVFWVKCFPVSHIFFRAICTAKKVVFGFIP